jgi:2-dehydro-3-deoxyphosphogluconate aldolase/(4S)-4-hydroxy-2-oxoglutarate aldolase
MHALFRGTSVIPVLTIERERDAVPLARALGEGGLSVIEVALRTPAAIAAIAAILRELPHIIVGAGTVKRAADVAAAVHAGARFLVSPGTTPELAASALATELPYLPGVATPSEVMAARALGICMMKLFPARALGGIGLLQALAPVFPGVAFCPTGASTSAKRRITWPCPTCRWSAAHGWRRKTQSLPAIGRASAGSPSAPPRSAGPRQPKYSLPTEGQSQRGRGGNAPNSCQYSTVDHSNNFSNSGKLAQP